MGIIACIIAAVKGHKTFAWVIGIWTAIAFLVAFSGYSNAALAPGWIFLVIAIGMKNLNKTASPSPVTSSTTKLTTVNPEKKYVCRACGNYSTGWYQKCPKCGTVGRMEKAEVQISTPALALEDTNSAPNRVLPELPVIQEAPKQAPKYCGNCGAALEPDSLFCSYCGVKLSE